MRGEENKLHYLHFKLYDVLESFCCFKIYNEWEMGSRYDLEGLCRYVCIGGFY